MNIECNIYGKIEIEIYPELEVWNRATNEEKQIFVKNALQEYISEDLRELLITFKIKE